MRIGFVLRFAVMRNSNVDNDFSILPVSNVDVSQKTPYEIKEYKDEILIDMGKEWDNSYIAANGSAINFNEKIYYFYHGLNSDIGYAEIGLAISSDGKIFDERTNEPMMILH